MKIELRVNGELLCSQEASTGDDWVWQDRYLIAMELINRLAKDATLGEAHREKINAWLLKNT